MNIVITGSQDWGDAGKVSFVLRKWRRQPGRVTVITQGRASGVDVYAEVAAQGYGYRTERRDVDDVDEFFEDVDLVLVFASREEDASLAVEAIKRDIDVERH